MTDENEPNQGNDTSNEPPPPEVVQLDPRTVQEGLRPDAGQIIEIIREIKDK